MAALLPTMEGNAEIVAQKKSGASCIAVSNNGKYLAARERDGFRVWSLEGWSWQEVMRIGTSEAHEDSQCVFSPDGTRLVTYDCSTMGRSVSIHVWSFPGGSRVRALAGHNDYVWTVRFSGDGRYMLSGGYDRIIRVWDTGSWRLAKTFIGHNEKIKSLDISHDNRFIASGSSDNRVKMWDFKSPRPLWEIFQRAGNLTINSIYFVDNGRNVITLGDFERTMPPPDMKIKMWNAANGSPVREFQMCGGELFELALSGDGRFVTGSGSGVDAINIWSVDTGKIIKTIPYTHDLQFSKIVFTPDGRYVITAPGLNEIQKNRGAIRVWSIR
ncbi:MAG: WD40 repeat domain-containing protein [Spirochaetes bacterium]|nr:WD40 repeat domain-containing protein [Spirochaetota bacterium]